MAATPTATSALDYLGDTSWPLATVALALAAEATAQAAVCRIPVVWTDDLAEALHRRVARNLAMRGLPLGFQVNMSDAAVAATRVGSDVELRRLEAPYRRLVIG